MRKAAQENESKISVPSAIDDESGLTELARDHGRRPLSAISISTTTKTRSAAPSEEKDVGFPRHKDQDLKPPDNLSLERWQTSQSLVA